MMSSAEDRVVIKGREKALCPESKLCSASVLLQRLRDTCGVALIFLYSWCGEKALKLLFIVLFGILLEGKEVVIW